jgi:hypothetical protein
MNRKIIKLLSVFIVLVLITFVANQAAKAESELQMSAVCFSSFSEGQAFYQIILTVSDVSVAKYVIEREQLRKTGSRIKVAELTYDEMAHNQFKYVDSTNLVKHGRYRYFLYTVDTNGIASELISIPAIVQNIQIKANTQNFLPVFVQNNATFTLGPKLDPENETLEYRLYTRVVGGGGEKPFKTWITAKDNKCVIVNFPETCEWKLVCIEAAQSIPDRTEIVLVNWSLFISSNG